MLFRNQLHNLQVQKMQGCVVVQFNCLLWGSLQTSFNSYHFRSTVEALLHPKMIDYVNMQYNTL